MRAADLLYLKKYHGSWDPFDIYRSELKFEILSAFRYKKTATLYEVAAMYTILKLFGHSPFIPLHAHMDKIAACVHKLPELFDALKAGNQEDIKTIAEEISKLEHQADRTKNDIRNHLPKSLYLPIDRNQFLEILTLQDSIADAAEDIAVLTTLKEINLPENLNDIFAKFLIKNIETFDDARAIINELQDLIESSFGGSEAEKVRKMVDNVAFKEHEVDLIQREFLKNIFNMEKEMSYTTFYLWLRISESLGNISNLSEKLAWRIRRTLELK